MEEMELLYPSVNLCLTVNGLEHNPIGCFDCNICLDLVQDPVVTLWPSLLLALHLQMDLLPELPSENMDHQQPQCPVCKAVVSQETLVPLYGRGLATKSLEAKASQVGMVIPQRPSTPRCGINTLTAAFFSSSTSPAQQLHHRSYQQQSQQYYSIPSSYGAPPDAQPQWYNNKPQ